MKSLLLVLAAILFAPALALTACDDPAPPEPDAYLYRITIDLRPYDARGLPVTTDESLRAFLPTDAELELSGKILGKRGSEVRIPKSILLSDPAITLRVVFESTCGRESIALESVPLYDRESEIRLRQSAANYEQEVFWKVRPKTWWESPSWVHVYVDNQDNADPVTVSLGKTEHRVEPGTTPLISLLQGRCPEKNELRLDGKQVGTINTKEPRAASLLDVTGNHCYLLDTAVYSNSETTAGGLPRPIHHRSRPGRQVHDIIKVDNLFKPNPPTSTVRVRRKGDMVSDVQTALLQIKCNGDN